MKTAIYLATAAISLFGAATANAETLFGLTFDNRIVRFDSTNPEAILASRSIVGIGVGEQLIGLDTRPANGRLYTMASNGNIYELVQTGMTYTATLTSTTTTAPSGSAFALDFNPVPDRLRVISNTGQNLRINIATGATTVDGMITADVSPVAITGAAYTNSFAGATMTTLYAIDTANDTLLRSTNPNAGTYVSTNLGGMTFAPLGLTFTTMNAIGFDISPNTGIAYLNIDSLLWRVNLMTGAGSSIGVVGAGPLRSIATTAFGVGEVPEPATWAMLIVGFGAVGFAARRRGTIATASA